MRAMNRRIIRPPKEWSGNNTVKRRQWVKRHRGYGLLRGIIGESRSVRGMIEHHIGFTPIPTAATAPLVINGDYAGGEFMVPLRTAEGTLVYSLTRGIAAASLNGITARHPGRKASLHITAEGRGRSAEASAHAEQVTPRRLLGIKPREILGWPELGRASLFPTQKRNLKLTGCAGQEGSAHKPAQIICGVILCFELFLLSAIISDTFADAYQTFSRRNG